MSHLELVLLALSLSLDALVAAVGAGALERGGVARALRVGVLFGFFQGGMPLIGYLLGRTLASYLAGYGTLLAGGVLLVLSGKMLLDGMSEEHQAEEAKISSLKVLVTLSIVTSIDALAAGITFAVIPVSLTLAVGLIGGITAVLCVAGYLLGARLKHLIGTKIEIVGALALAVLALKMLLV